MYVVIWEFTVSNADAIAFEKVYDSKGDWATLFREARGYIRTELLRDIEFPGRYMTVDYWDSRNDYDTMRRTLNERYQELDARSAGLTLTERKVGAFE